MLFNRTEKAVTDLSQAITQDVTQAIAVGKAAVKPAVAGVFATAAGYLTKIQKGVESGELFKRAQTEAETAPAAKPANDTAESLPTEAENAAIRAARKAGKTDAQIAEFLGISILKVNMSF